MFMPAYTHTVDDERTVDVRVENFTLEGTLAIPRGAQGLVVFAGGSGSRHSAHNRFVAGALRAGGLATLLFDLLTPAEEAIDQRTGDYRFDIPLLALRLAGASDWLNAFPETRRLRLGYFGAGAGAAAALVDAAEHPDLASAIVAHGGRPDLAGDALGRVRTPTLLLVGAGDEVGLDLNREALARLTGNKRLEVIAHATDQFEEPGTMEAVTGHARRWFEQYLNL